MLSKASISLALLAALAACSTGHTSGTPSAPLTSPAPTSSTRSSAPLPTPSPRAISISVVSNLDGKPLTAQVYADGRFYTARAGKITLTRIPPGTLLDVFASGYDDAEVSRSGRVVLSAGPGVTATWLARAQIARRYNVQIKFIHPHELQYITAENARKSMSADDARGHSQLRWTLSSVTLLPQWHYRGCNGNGATTFKQVAAVKYVAVFSTPSGGRKTNKRVEHLVLFGGLWRVFRTFPKYCS